MKILLIRPTTAYKGEYIPPLGVAYLGAVLEREGFEVEVIDFVEKSNAVLITKEIKNRKADIIGISFETENRFTAFDTIRAAKEASPKSFLVAGGVHPSLTAEETLANIQELDTIVRGEGEETFLELCRTIECGGDLSKIKGLSFKRGKEIIHNSGRPFIHNLDSIPFPALHLLDLRKYYARNDCLSVITARGCPFNCLFCANFPFWGKANRFRSVSNVMEEIEYLEGNYQFKKILFIDSTFTVSRERTEEFCRALIEKRRKGNKPFFWNCSIRCDKIITKDLLLLMKEAGCTEVLTGIETGSAQMLSQMKKNVSQEQMGDIIKWCREIGLKVYCFFMMGLPGETKEDTAATFNLIEELQRFSHVRVSEPFWLEVYPGTEIEKLACQQGLLPADFNWSKSYTIPNTYGVPYFIEKQRKDEFEELTKLADELKFKLRLKYHGFSIIDILKTLLRLKINSFRDIAKYFKRTKILLFDS